MNVSVIIGSLLAVIAVLVVAAGFASGNVFFNIESVDTRRQTAPVTFWAVASFWILIAAFGIAIAIRSWGV